MIEKEHPGIDLDRIEEYLKMFKEIDKDGSKSIDRTELETAFQAILGRRPKRSEMDNMCSEIDKDGDGDIEFNEFFCKLKLLYTV